MASVKTAGQEIFWCFGTRKFYS